MRHEARTAARRADPGRAGDRPQAKVREVGRHGAGAGARRAPLRAAAAMEQEPAVGVHETAAGGAAGRRPRNSGGTAGERREAGGAPGGRMAWRRRRRRKAAAPIVQIERGRTIRAGGGGASAKRRHPTARTGGQRAAPPAKRPALRRGCRILEAGPTLGAARLGACIVVGYMAARRIALWWVTWLHGGSARVCVRVTGVLALMRNPHASGRLLNQEHCSTDGPALLHLPRTLGIRPRRGAPYLKHASEARFPVRPSGPPASVSAGVRTCDLPKGKSNKAQLLV